MFHVPRRTGLLFFSFHHSYSRQNHLTQVDIFSLALNNPESIFEHTGVKHGKEIFGKSLARTLLWSTDTAVMVLRGSIRVCLVCLSVWAFYVFYAWEITDLIFP